MRLPHLSSIKKSPWKDQCGRVWLFGEQEKDLFIVYIYGSKIEEDSSYVVTDGETSKTVQVFEILEWRRIRTGGFKMMATITI